MTTEQFDPRKLYFSHLAESIEVKKRVMSSCVDSVVAAAELITRSIREGGKLLICGNGGSAADSQHFAAEFMSRLTKDFERAALPAIALTTDTSFLTAFANDCGFDGGFARQVEGLGKAGDVLFGISTSGSSKNVVKAFEQARKLGVNTVALVGIGGCLSERATVAIQVPSNNTQFIQESHIAIEHCVCAMVERMLFPEVGGAVL